MVGMACVAAVFLSLFFYGPFEKCTVMVMPMHGVRACGVSYRNFLFGTQCLAFGHQPMPHRPSPFLLFSLFDFVPLLR
jgi:hypothetical protein